MKGNGMLIREVVGGECIIGMGLYMRVNGMMIREMVKECLDWVRSFFIYLFNILWLFLILYVLWIMSFGFDLNLIDIW